ncbi:MAG: divergent polysaccharide deacetylase family protein [Spirochaeta sp.]|nr:divergent polysaccharide deacetylase family protein [Spirochaeta sp.]
MQHKGKSSKTRAASKAIRAVLLLLLITLMLIIILLLFPRAEKKPEPVEEKVLVPAAPPEKPVEWSYLCLVIDDAGYNMANLRELLKLPAAFTVSVLPGLPMSREAAVEVTKAGKEVILHCPMEALSGEDPGSGTILSTHPAEEINTILTSNFSFVPGAVGTNNHMGSKVTSDQRVMAEVMLYLKNHNKYFLDSKTTADSVARQEALKLGVPYLVRDVFLDNDTQQEAVKQQFLKGMEIAGSQGSAILIGHAQNPAVTEVLVELYPLLAERSIKMITLNRLLSFKGIMTNDNSGD